MMIKFFHNQRGQGLLEALVATTIIVVGISGVIGLSGNNLIASNISTSELVAVNLAREAVEVITNMRDSNYLDDTVVWNYGLDNIANTTNNDGILEYNTTNHTWAMDFLSINSTFTDAATLIYFDPSTSLYLQNSTPDGAWQVTPYRRLINIYKICSNSVDDYITAGTCGSGIVGYNIVVEMQWNDHGNTRNLTLEKRIFNWR